MTDKVDTKKSLLEALEKTLGIVTDACKMVGVSRQTFYVYMNDDPEFKAAVEEISDVALDFAESKLFQLIDGVYCEKTLGTETIVYQKPPDTIATIFFLKTKGKKRGYIEKHEFEHSGKTTFEVGLPKVNEED